MTPENRTLRRFSFILTTAFALVGTVTAEASPGDREVRRATGAKQEGEEYVLELKPEGMTVEGKGVPGCVAGKECNVALYITAKDPFILDPKFATRVKASASAASPVQLTKALITKADGRLGTTRGLLPITFIASSPGRVTVTGDLSFSICSTTGARACKAGRATLTVDVEVGN
jgi:hypothetical protein